MNNQQPLQSWWQLTTIQIGGAICMPLLLVGQHLARNYGFMSALKAIILGNLALCALSLIKVALAHSSKKNTIENARDFFGSKGSFLMGTTMVVCCTGWFALQLNMVGISALHLFSPALQMSELMQAATIIFFGILMTGFSLYGLKGIARFADYTLPILLISIGYGVFKAYSQPAVHLSYQAFSLASCAFVIASTLLVVIDIPTYYRVSRSFKDSVVSICFLYLIATPIIQAAGAYIGAHSHHKEMVQMLTTDSGMLWQIVIVLFLILAGWTTNNTNMYSSVVTLKTLRPRLKESTATLILGTVGTLVALYPLVTHYETTLSAMAIFIASMGAVIACNYLATLFTALPITPFLKSFNIGAWFIGVSAGLISFNGYFTLCNSALCDSFLWASAATVTAYLTTLVYKEKKA